jgi:hypothetical protein
MCAFLGWDFVCFFWLVILVEEISIVMQFHKHTVDVSAWVYAVLVGFCKWKMLHEEWEAGFWVVFVGVLVCLWWLCCLAGLLPVAAALHRS